MSFGRSVEDSKCVAIKGICVTKKEGKSFPVTAKETEEEKILTE